MKKISTLLCIAFCLSIRAQIITTAIANLTAPTGITFDKQGNLYIAEAYDIRKVNTAGIISMLTAGTPGYSGDGGQSTNAQVNFPYATAIDDTGNIYIADRDNNRIRKINTSGIITAIAGIGSGGYSGDGGLATDAQLNNPSGIAIDAFGNIYVADRYNSCVRKINTAGIISTYAGNPALNDQNGNGSYSGDGGQATSAGLFFPFGLCFDKQGNLYMADSYNGRIRKVNTAGIISTVVGNGVPGYAGDGGLATAAALNYPQYVLVDKNGVIYISDRFSQTIRMVNEAGIINTIAGDNNSGYAGDGGNPMTAEFNDPQGIALDSIGNIYIADYYNNRIRKIINPASTLNFNGINNYCVVPKFTTIFDNFTLEARVKWAGTTGNNQFIFANGSNAAPSYSFNGYVLFLDPSNSNNITLCIEGITYLQTTAQLTPGVWQTVSLVRSGGVWVLYLDGVAFNFTNNTQSGFAISGYFSIGSDQSGGANFYGDMDEARFWSRPLCQNEIQSRLSCQLKGNEAGLLAYYNFNQGLNGQDNSAITTLIDSSGHGHNLTLHNFTLNGSTSNWMASHKALTNHCSLYQPPAPTISAIGDTTFCLGNSVTLTSSAADTYTWSNGNSTSSINVNTQQNYSVSVTNPFGCYGTSTSNAVYVTVLSPATPNICLVTTDSATLYNYNTIYWDNSMYTGVDSFIVYRYVSNVNNYVKIGTVSKDSSRLRDTARHIPNIGIHGGDPNYTSYKYTLAIKDTCGNIGLQSPRHESVFLQDQHNGNFNINPYVIGAGQSNPVTGYDLYVDVTGTGNNFQYLTTITGTSAYDPGYSPSYVYRVDILGFNCVSNQRLAAGNNNIYGVRQRAHSNTARQAGTTAVYSAIDMSNKILIYPNPASSTINVSFSGIINCTTIKLFDATGRLILQHVVNSNTVQVLDVQKIEPGIYFIDLNGIKKTIAITK